jgi:uncharacterized repeat protein (TIGR01451 family)
VEFDLVNAQWYVSPSGSFDNDCLTPATPCPTISYVFGREHYLPGDTILVEEGIYTGGGSQVLSLDQDVILKGGWDESFTDQVGYSTLDGESTRRVIFISSDTSVEMDHFIVQNGLADLANGAGISNSGDLFLSDCAIVNNTSNMYGGGISHRGGTMVIDTCTISGNTAGYGSAGMESQGGASYINNSVISGNNGGGIYGSGLEIRSSTIAYNDGVGITSESGMPGIAGTIWIENTLIGANLDPSTPDCTGDLASLGFNLIGDTTGCNIAATIGDIFDVDPEVDPLVGFPGYHPLTGDSPAINAGNPLGCENHLGIPLIVDHRGAPRLGRCDIGAYEAQAYKEADNDDATLGDILSFSIHFRNWSDSTRTYTVTDTLPEELSYMEGTLSATLGTPIHSAGMITWSETVDPHQEVSITFDAEVGSILGVLVNSVVINDGSEDEIRSATITVDAPICSLTKYEENPVLDVGAPGSWDEDWVLDPSVLYTDSTYWMWYSGYGSSDIFQIGLATSPDGLTWIRSEANPVVTSSQSWEINGVSGPSVLLDGTTFKMWYTGVDEFGVARIGYATSSDGILWTKYADNPVLDIGAGGSWEDEDIAKPTVIKFKNSYHLWYSGFDGSVSRIGYATSSDGMEWTKDTANPVLDVGHVGDWDWLTIYGPDVVKVGDTLRMWYSGETLPPSWQTGFAESVDGSLWTRMGLSIPEGTVGCFDEFSADHASVLVEGSDYRIWYGGIDSDDTYTIGHATAQTCRPPANRIYLPIMMMYSAAPHTCPADYFDDFSDPGSGWLIYEDPEVKYGYADQQYQVWFKTPEDGVWITPGARASDFTVALSARRTSGMDGPYGILFGISQDWSELYEVSIDEDYYAIWKFDSGWSLITWDTSSAIQTGTAWNRIKVTRDGSAISVYINDVFQTTVYDSSFTGFRRIGLVGYSTSSSAREFRFDDFAIYPISCDAATASALGIEWGKAEVQPGTLHSSPRELE